MRDQNETLRNILKKRDPEFRELQQRLEELQQEFFRTTETKQRLDLSRRIESLHDQVNVRLSLARSA